MVRRPFAWPKQRALRLLELIRGAAVFLVLPCEPCQALKLSCRFGPDARDFRIEVLVPCEKRMGLRNFQRSLRILGRASSRGSF